MNYGGLIFVGAIVCLAIVAIVHDASTVRKAREYRQIVFDADRERDDMEREFAEWSCR